MADWYYAESGKPEGPLTDEDVRSLILTERVGAGTMMWRDGLDGWKSLQDIPVLAGMLPKSAPVPPPIPGVVPPPLPDMEPPKSTEHDDFLAGLASPRPGEAGPYGQGGPWSRFFARQFDMTLWGTVFGLILGVTLPSLSPSSSIEFFKDSNRVGQGITILAGAFVINAIVMAIFGNSIGKRMFGLKAIPLPDSGPPRFAWHLNREFMVYVFGLGLGIPIVGWVMAYRNYGEVKLGRPARYDRTLARMTALPISDGRRAAAMIFSIIFVVGILFGTSWLNVMDTSTRARSFAWVNPATGITTTVPAGFTYSLNKADDGSTIYGFVDPESGLQVLLASENAIAQLPTLQGYADAVKTNVAGSLVLGTFNPVAGGVLQADGKSVDGSYTVSFLVRQIGQIYWRVVLLDLTPPRNVIGVPVPPIVEALWKSAGS